MLSPEPTDQSFQHMTVNNVAVCTSNTERLWLTCDWDIHKRLNIKVRACCLHAWKLSKDQETARRQLLMAGHFHASLKASSSHKPHPRSVRMYTWRGSHDYKSIQTLCNDILTWWLEFKISGFRARFRDFKDFNAKRTRFQASCEHLGWDHISTSPCQTHFYPHVQLANTAMISGKYQAYSMCELRLAPNQTLHDTS